MLKTQPALADLYLEDETAWLDAMAELLRLGSYSSLDHEHLQEYLEDMGRSQRREVHNRLALLLAHILKWLYQPDRRSGGWRATIQVQQRDLNRNAGKGVLRRHMEECLAAAYRDAIDYASAETLMPPADFPRECPWTLAEVLSFVPED